MSLEQAIQENTAAIRELIAALSVKAMPHQVTDVHVDETIKAEVAKIEAKKPTPAPAETVVSSPVVAEPVTEPQQPVAARDVFRELEHEARAATKEGAAGLKAWWATLSRADKTLMQPFKAEYERLAEETDAQRGLAL